MLLSASDNDGNKEHGLLSGGILHPLHLQVVLCVCTCKTCLQALSLSAMFTRRKMEQLGKKKTVPSWHRLWNSFDKDKNQLKLPWKSILINLHALRYWLKNCQCEAYLPLKWAGKLTTNGVKNFTLGDRLTKCQRSSCMLFLVGMHPGRINQVWDHSTICLFWYPCRSKANICNEDFFIQ